MGELAEELYPLWLSNHYFSASVVQLCSPFEGLCEFSDFTCLFFMLPGIVENFQNEEPMRNYGVSFLGTYEGHLLYHSNRHQILIPNISSKLRSNPY